MERGLSSSKARYEGLGLVSLTERKHWCQTTNQPAKSYVLHDGCVFRQAPQDNLRFLDVSLLLTDVAAMADEVDAQLAQSMDSYMNAMQQATAA